MAALEGFAIQRVKSLPNEKRAALVSQLERLNSDLEAAANARPRDNDAIEETMKRFPPKNPMMRIAAAMLCVCVFGAADISAQTADPSSELLGLWSAKRRYGPDARGTVIIQRSGTTYTADMMGFTVPVRVIAGDVSFDLPNELGTFRGKVQSNGSIFGIWFPYRGAFSTPVRLTAKRRDRWDGQVAPWDESVTLYLLVTKRPDGSMAALLRNTDRDFGAWEGVHSIVRVGGEIRLMARRRNQKEDHVVASGSLDTAQKVLLLYFPWRGGSFDFRRDTAAMSGFYPRGSKPARYSYVKPPAFDDAWPVATPEEVALDRKELERLVQALVDLPMDSINAPQVHSLLVARGGKLVLEEYFHGEYRDKLHDTRSASKSVAATVIGAAMHAGAPVKLSTPIYQLMNGGSFPSGLEPRKRAMTLEHLMSMSSGYYCDDDDDNAPGNESTMWDQREEPNFYKYALRLPMAMAPGEKAIYCSTNPNLALGVIGRAAGESAFYLFDRLVAAPMSITRYVWSTDRAYQPYGGGGMRLSLRDFAKFGQLMLDSGTWHGRRILSREFVARASSTVTHIGESPYGLLWWPQEYTYRGRKVRAFAALGAGGQAVIVFPELDLVVADFSGSYSSRGWRYTQVEAIPNYILPAIRN